MVTDKESVQLLMSIFSGTADALTGEEQTAGVVMACANLIESVLLATAYGNAYEAEKGLRILADEMVRNIHAKAKRGHN